MSTEYFVDANGAYLGAFVDGATSPEGAVNAPYAPDDARQVWDGSAWSAIPTPAPVPPSPREWLERLSPTTQQAISAAAIANPSILLWLLKASGSTAIDVTLAETVAGVGALVTAGVLTTSEQALLLTP